MRHSFNIDRCFVSVRQYLPWKSITLDIKKVIRDRERWEWRWNGRREEDEVRRNGSRCITDTSCRQPVCRSDRLLGGTFSSASDCSGLFKHIAQCFFPQVFQDRRLRLEAGKTGWRASRDDHLFPSFQLSHVVSSDRSGPFWECFVHRKIYL